MLIFDSLCRDKMHTTINFRVVTKGVGLNLHNGMIIVCDRSIVLNWARILHLGSIV